VTVIDLLYWYLVAAAIAGTLMTGYVVYVSILQRRWPDRALIAAWVLVTLLPVLWWGYFRRRRS
jgi:hypothetical protein